MLKGTNYTELKSKVYLLDGGICHICRCPVSFNQAVLDHIIPRNAHGRAGAETSDEYWNIRIAHKGCNSRRSDAVIEGQIRLNITEPVPEPPCCVVSPLLLGELYELTCTRCSHTWWPRSETPPRYCPRCNSPYWNRERKDTIIMDKPDAQEVKE